MLVNNLHQNKPFIDLSYVVPVKSTVEILQNFVVFSEYMNFNYTIKVSRTLLKNPQIVICSA